MFQAFKKRIYLDYAALTPIDKRVLREVSKYSRPEYGNPSSWYKDGVKAKKALEGARKGVANFIHAHADEIFFSSGGTESNNLAIQGVIKKAIRDGIAKPHIIVSNIEHSSVMEAVNALEKEGCEVTRLAVDHTGVISLEELKKAIKDNTVLISIMYVNNEIGVVQPIKEIGKVVRKVRGATSGGSTSRIYPLFHTDVAQAALYYGLDMEKISVDLMTLDASKVYGPRGVGALYIRRNTPVEEIIHGGGQERGLRSGTENLPGIMGFVRALEIAELERETEIERLESLKREFIQGLKKIRPDAEVQPMEVRPHEVAPHIVNISIPGIDNEFFVFQLDAKGIAVSTKSSCLRDEDESYVLKAIGADSKTAVRFSFGRWTTVGDIKKALRVIAKVGP